MVLPLGRMEHNDQLGPGFEALGLENLQEIRRLHVEGMEALLGLHRELEANPDLLPSEVPGYAQDLELLAEIDQGIATLQSQEPA